MAQERESSDEPDALRPSLSCPRRKPMRQCATKASAEADAAAASDIAAVHNAYQVPSNGPA